MKKIYLLLGLQQGTLNAETGTLVGFRRGFGISPGTLGATTLPTAGWLLRRVKLGQVESQRVARVGLHVTANANQTLAVLVEHVLEANDDALEIGLAALANVVADLAEVDIVQGGVHYKHTEQKKIMLATVVSKALWHNKNENKKQDRNLPSSMTKKGAG